MSSRNIRALGGGDLLGFLSSLPRLQLRPSPYSLSRAVWPWPAGVHPATEVLDRCSRTGTNDLPHGAFQHKVLTSLYSLFLLFTPSPWLVVAILALRSKEFLCTDRSEDLAATVASGELRSMRVKLRFISLQSRCSSFGGSCKVLGQSCVNRRGPNVVTLATPASIVYSGSMLQGSKPVIHVFFFFFPPPPILFVFVIVSSFTHSILTNDYHRSFSYDL